MFCFAKQKSRTKSTVLRCDFYYKSRAVSSPQLDSQGSLREICSFPISISGPIYLAIIIGKSLLPGLLLKDVLASEMEEYVSGYYDNDLTTGQVMQYVPDTSAYYGSPGPSSYYGDPTRAFDTADVNFNSVMYTPTNTYHK